ncbi:MAG: phosphodiesterase [Gordonia sp. (in: high G+C Gram-positive bacteria)]
MLIAQISDLHLCAADVLYQGVVDSTEMVAAAIKQIDTLSAGVPDVVLVSGDIVDHGTPDEYSNARDLLERITQPLVIIPGNHDDRENCRLAFAHRTSWSDSGPLHTVADKLGPVRIIGLDITVPGEHHGDVTEDAAEWLEATLSQEPDRPTIVMIHQHPFMSGIPYLDLYDCRHGHRLANIIKRFPAVERVVCGHVHRHITVRFGGTTLCTAPSTTTAISLQLHPDATPQSYIEPPGLLLHHWTPENGLITHHFPIGQFDGPYPFA